MKIEKRRWLQKHFGSNVHVKKKCHLGIFAEPFANIILLVYEWFDSKYEEIPKKLYKLKT